MNDLQKFFNDVFNECNIFFNTLEINPSKIILVNSIILFSHFFEDILINNFKYDKKNMPKKFIDLIKIMETKFPYNKSCLWNKLRILNKMRNHVSHRTDSNILFIEFLPDYITHYFDKKILNMPFMRLLIPEISDLWKFLISDLFAKAAFTIKLKIEADNNPTLHNELYDMFFSLWRPYEEKLSKIKFKIHKNI